ncbi:LPS export ABC transporter permease LptF [Terrihabitans rhizophilus]|uniref:LPS export ABC transporter permease LptF n=1 Tax=Terrihabitans rhizophilus TaxID=3092662 RepID=A0ABU4RKA8_9HYPH|nr:LPS export ABC transporter permease LptF [Terrihabitans sp. PJ23]MDX6805262.1 LPS export ABC transporter permease LptF [Terrihabitans sp. PJ23]
MLTALDRYIIRMTGASFLTSLFATTAVVWVTQSLRQIDLLTSKGQSLWTFLLVTTLGLPSLALVVAPVALFGAVMWVLNRLNSDSELAAMSAAGATPLQLMRPFIVVTVVVAIATGVLSTSAIPASLRAVREIVTAIRADVIVNVLRPGAFSTFSQGITVHVRASGAGNSLVGMLIEDDSEPGQNLVYTAERGRVVQAGDTSYIVLENGALQRKASGSDDVSIVVFESYAFDLSPLASQSATASFRPREQTVQNLLNPPAEAVDTSGKRGRIRAELHDRLTNPIYPVVFMLIAFAALGRTRSNRQGRISATLAAVAAIVAVRVAGLGLINLASSAAWAVPALYAFLFLTGAAALALIFGRGISLPRRRSLQQA